MERRLQRGLACRETSTRSVVFGRLNGRITECEEVARGWVGLEKPLKCSASETTGCEMARTELARWRLALR